MTTTQALKLRSEASQALAEALRGLGGAERLEAIEECARAGVPLTEVARLLGISRQRLHQLRAQAVGRTRENDSLDATRKPEDALGNRSLGS